METKINYARVAARFTREITAYADVQEALSRELADTLKELNGAVDAALEDYTGEHIRCEYKIAQASVRLSLCSHRVNGARLQFVQADSDCYAHLSAAKKQDVLRVLPEAVDDIITQIAIKTQLLRGKNYKS
jgi:hypothetical protein